MKAYLSGKTEYGWYICLYDESIVAGLGVIENDFHDRKDLTPNVCAVYAEEEHREKGLAGNLLNKVVDVQLLRSLDCDGAQGFWFSKAIPAEEFERRYLCS